MSKMKTVRLTEEEIKFIKDNRLSLARLVHDAIYEQMRLIKKCKRCGGSHAA